MPTGSLSDFMSGLQSGYGFGAQIDQMRDTRRQRNAQAANARTNSLPPPQQGTGEPGAQGGGIQVNPQIMQQLAQAVGKAAPPLPGLTPQGAPPSAMPPQGRPMTNPMAAPAPQAPVQPQMMGNMGAPPAQPQGDPSLSGTANATSSGQPADAWEESQQNLKSLTQATKAANPGIDNLTLAYAVHDAIEDIKGVSPSTKATMTAQMQYMKLQVEQQYKSERLRQFDMDLQVKMQNAKTAEERADILREGNQLRAQIMRESIEERYYAADKSAESRRYAADTGAESRRDVANIGAESRQDVADTNLEGRVYAADQGVRSSQARGMEGNKGMSPAPERPQRRARPLGRSPSAGPESPPAPGARKAPDGKWYVRDPNRPGKYLMVG